MDNNLADVVSSFNFNASQMQEKMARIKQFENGYANIFYEQLIEEINSFDNQLNQTEEVGVRLVSYGNSIQFSITDIGYQNPYLIYFYGMLEDGSPIQLVQNVSQISFVLIAMKRKNPEEPKRPIGFLNK